MTRRRLAFSLCLLATWLTASAAAARPTAIMDHESCIFEEFVPRTAVPYYMVDHEGAASVSRLVGASLYVAAARGRSAERLAMHLDRDLRAPVREGADDSCRPNLSGVHAVVVATGRGFWIVFVAGDERTATALVEWCERVVAAHGKKTRGKKGPATRRQRGARAERSAR